MGEHFTSGPFSEITGNFSYFHDYQRMSSWGAGYSDLYTVLSGERKLFLKALNKEHGASTENLARLQREYKIFEMLYGNEHIVRCIGWREDAEVGPCIVMEYVDGETLADYLKTSPSNKDRKRILNELLDALAFIHSHQVVHNDLKSENILITRNGHNVKLIDFGYADCDSNSDKATGGTIAYASPELLNQEVTDATSDIYSLGFIIKALFPHRYGGIVRKCQCKKASRRYRNVEEVRRALSLRDDFGRIMWPLLLAVSMLVWFFLSKAPISQSSIDNEVAPTVSGTVPDTVFVVQMQHDTIMLEVPSNPKLEVVKVQIPDGTENLNVNQDSLSQAYLDLYQRIEQERIDNPQFLPFLDEEKGLYGYEDADGRVVIPAIYQDAKEFREGYAVCCLDGKYGLVAKDGSQHLFNYEEISLAPENRRFYVGWKKSLFTNCFVITLHPLPVETMSVGMEGIDYSAKEITQVRLLGLWGILDADGNELESPKFKYRLDFNKYGFAVAETEEGKGIVNIQMQHITELKYPFVKKLNDGAFLYGQYERNFGVVTERGKVSIEAGSYVRTEYLEGLYMILAKAADGTFTIINSDGKEIVPKSESIIVSEGVAIIKNGDETQFLDLSALKKKR